MSDSLFKTGTFALGVGLLVSACHEGPSVVPSPELPTARVSVTSVGASDTVQLEKLPGTVVPRTKAAIESKIMGRILELNAEPGQTVEADEVLVRIQAPEVSAKVDQAAAELKLADANAGRIQKLYEQQAATRAELDAVESRLHRATAALAEAKSMEAYAIIRAPFDAVVSGKFVNVGDLSTPGRPLIEIEVPSGRQFVADVSESLIDGIALGDQHSIQFSDEGQLVSAELAEINPAGVSGSRSWAAKWNLPDDVNLRSGAYGRIAIPSGEARSILIPRSAVMVRGQLEQVFVAVDGYAVLRLIKTGKKNMETVEILSGLVEGDQLIVDSTVRITEGQPLEY